MTNFGIIGFGHIGKRHAHFIQQNPNTQLSGIYDISPSAREAASLLDTRLHDSYTALLADEDIDVVCVCTPNYLHAQHSIEASRSGKHVLCEKPMCMTRMEAAEMMEAADVADKKLFVVKQNRYNAPVAWLHDLIRNQKLGNILQVSVQCYWNRNRAYYEQSDWRGDLIKDGGCLYTQFSHFVDIMYYLLGDLQVITGSISNKMHPYINTEDMGSFLLKSPQGADVYFQYSTCAYESNMEGSMTLLAEKGSIKIGGKYLNELSYAKVENIDAPQIIDRGPNNHYSLGYEGSQSHHDLVIQNVLDTLQNKAPIMTSPEQGSAVVHLIERMYARAR